MDEGGDKQRWAAAHFWPIVAGVLFLVFALRGQSLAAVLIGVSGVLAIPALSDTFMRYGAGPSTRFKIGVGTAALGCLLVLLTPSQAVAPTTAQVADCRAVDGDTLNCSGEAIRLLGIDAPEMPGHCADGRQCAPGDPFAAQASLQSRIQLGVSLERVGTDHYGRTLAMVYVDGQSLSCEQLRKGQAVYVGKWDDGERVARECGDAIPSSP
jgi:endonuclease YncB( thermonuclease family)